MSDRNISRRLALSAIAGVATLIALAVLFLSDNRGFKFVGATVIVALLGYSLASDWFDAWQNEKHVDRHPHLLRNDAIGKTVAAAGDFERAAGPARGLVILNGETWNARALHDHVPRDGEIMSVTRREGLTLYVEPQRSAAARDEADPGRDAPGG